MEDEIHEKKAVNNKYRLVIMNDDTFKEIRSYRLTMNNLYILLSVIFVVISFFVLALVIFTPLKKLIPGYADVNNNEKFVELVHKMEDLEGELEAQNAYINGIQNLLDGVDTDVELSQIPINQINQEPEMVNSGAQLSVPVAVHTNKLDQLFFISPIRGEISQKFKIEGNHFGTDILAPANTPIKSVMDGIVVTADWSIDSGNTISVQHPNNITSVYKHNSVLLKKVGNLVKAGEALAIIGNSGELTNGPHLHFELWYEGKPVNPEEYLSF